MPRNVPRMTRAHFRLIAEVISQLPEEHKSEAAYAFSRKLHETNSNFNLSKFLDACLGESE